MESSSTSKQLTFGDLQCRLIQILKLKLDNGEFTERGLARLSGISQSQVHNLLKGARRLSQDCADILLEAIHLSVLDLLSEADLSARDLARAAPNTCPRKNPASASTPHLTVTEQAS